MLITGNLKVAELILHDHSLLSLLNRFGIKLGFREKTVMQVCNENDINLDFFLEIVNVFHDNEYSSANLNLFPLHKIIEYLLKSHSYYRNIKIPTLKKLAGQIIWLENHEENKTLLMNFILNYVHEVLEHIDFEEKTVYPYIIEIEENYNKFLKNGTKNVNPFSIDQYKSVHQSINSKLLDLKNIIIKYLPPAENYDICHELINEIFIFEKDLEDHSKIENRILISRVKTIESLF